MRVSKRWAAIALAVIPAFGFAAQSAVGQGPPVFTLEGETFEATPAADVGTIATDAYCGTLTSTSTIKYTTTGLATGPLLGVGTYWEQGRVTIGPRDPLDDLNGRPIVGFKARFTIYSWLGRVTGTKQLAPTSEGSGECLGPLHQFETLATYTASIPTADGTCTTDGETIVTLAEDESSDFAAFVESFTDGGTPSVCSSICPPTADDDHDGLIDSREDGVLTLLGNADSDFDGIKDGNEDSDGDGEDDEDEDDDDGCPDRDSDGDGEDDEDEDD